MMGARRSASLDENLERIQHYRKWGLLLVATGAAVVAGGAWIVSEVALDDDMVRYLVSAVIFAGVALVMAGLFSFMVLTLTYHSMKRRGNNRGLCRFLVRGG